MWSSIDSAHNTQTSAHGSSLTIKDNITNLLPLSYVSVQPEMATGSEYWQKQRINKQKKKWRWVYEFIIKNSYKYKVCVGTIRVKRWIKIEMEFSI